ncbi:hypothetical protein [Streptomyces sp. NPDC001966]
MSEQAPAPEPELPEINPLRWPPCECARCRAGGEGEVPDSALIRRLRTKVAEENGLRSSLRQSTRGRRQAAGGGTEI